MAIIGGMGGIPPMTGNITPDRVLASYSGYSSDPWNKITGTIQSLDERAIFPSRNTQIIPKGVYLSGDQIIQGISEWYMQEDGGEFQSTLYTIQWTITMKKTFQPDIINIFGGTSFGAENIGLPVCTWFTIRRGIGSTQEYSATCQLYDARQKNIISGYKLSNDYFDVSNGSFRVGGPGQCFNGFYYWMAIAY